MKASLPLAAIFVLAVGGCDQPKPRPAAAAAAAAAAANEALNAPPATPAAAHQNLTKRAEMATFTLDVINGAPDPLNTPAVIKAGEPATFSGFGFDPVAKAAGKTIDIVVDGVAYATVCCHGRQDVASYYKTQAVLASGFTATLPAGVIKPGVHTVEVRVISPDGKSYFDGPPISFQAR